MLGLYIYSSVQDEVRLNTLELVVTINDWVVCFCGGWMLLDIKTGLCLFFCTR